MAKKKNISSKQKLSKAKSPSSKFPPKKSGFANQSSLNPASSNLAFANKGDSLNVFHYLFLFAIFFAINGFNPSATIGGPSITDHLFVKNLFASNVLMPITLLFVFIMLVKTNKLIIHWNLQSKIIIALMGYGFLSLAWAYHPGFTVTKLTIWIMGFFGYFWAYDVIRRGGLPVLLQVIFFSGVTVAAIGLWQVYGEVSPAQEQEIKAAGGRVQRLIDMAAGPSSSFGNRNMANHLVVLSFPLCIYLIGSATLKRAKILYFVGAAMLLLFSFHTQTRAAYIAIGMEIFAMLLFLLPGKARIFGYIGALGFAALGLILLDFTLLGQAVFIVLAIFFTILLLVKKPNESPMTWYKNYTIYALAIGLVTFALANYSYFDSSIVPFWDVLLGRAESTATGLDSNAVIDDIGNGAANLRIQIWRDSWEIFKSSPIVGYGLGCFYAVFHFDAFDIVNDSAIRYPHNEYFSILTELGLIGMLFFIALVANALRMSFGAYKLLQNSDYQHSDRYEKFLFLIVITAAALGTMVNASFTFPYEYVSPYLVVSCYMAAVGWIYSDTKNKLKDAQAVSNSRFSRLKNLVWFKTAQEVSSPDDIAVVSDQKVLSGSIGWSIGAVIMVLSVMVFSLNIFWGSRLAQANENISTGQWKSLKINQSPLLLHANYHWTFPAILSTFSSRQDCKAVDAAADSLLKEGYSPKFYSAIFSKVQCGKGQAVERVTANLSRADLVSTYKRDGAWNNLLRISHTNKKMILVYQHLDKMEKKFPTWPQGVQHRYANSLGRRYLGAALKVTDAATRTKLLDKGEKYLQIAMDGKDINTKYKADLVRLYLHAKKLDQAEQLLTAIEKQRPESELTESLRKRLAAAKQNS